MNLNGEWKHILKDYLDSDNYKMLKEKIDSEYNKSTVFPEYNLIFNSLNLTPYSNIKVVILGQDPYHGDNEAHGLSFSVRDGVKMPPSLKNIFKELYYDLHIEMKTSDLTCWAKEGVLLLNSVLTVEKDKPASHSKLGWESFTDYIIKTINEKRTPVVFILWGNYAKEKKKLITNNIHYIIESPHPSPFSANKGFFGSRPFSKANSFLEDNGIEPVKWY